MHNICTAFIYNIEFLCILYALNHLTTIIQCAFVLFLSLSLTTFIPWQFFFDIWWRCFEDEDFDVQVFFLISGFTSCTLTNPIWFVKTRLQLDQKRNNRLTVRECIRQINEQHGIRGFYKGITASYYGMAETVIHFVIYEAIKARLQERYSGDSTNWTDFLRCMVAGATSKTIATCVAYPHEVARTRLREEGTKYRSFFQTLLVVYKEEGRAGLYRGIGTQLIRQIPNTAIMMATYELVVYLLSDSH